MTTKWTTCSRRLRRDGLTLLEVVAGIAILGTILVVVVLSKSRHTRQLALTQRRNVAVRAADELIAGWWTRCEGVPVGERGAVEADASLAWETRVVPNDAIEKLGARVVRVELRESEPDRWAADDGTGDPLVAVDLVLPDPGREAADPRRNGQRGTAGREAGRTDPARGSAGPAAGERP